MTKSEKYDKALYEIIEEYYNGDIDNPEVFQSKERLEYLTSSAKMLFQALYYESIEEGYYWQYCDLKIYQDTFEHRLNNGMFVNSKRESKELFLDVELSMSETKIKEFEGRSDFWGLEISLLSLNNEKRKKIFLEKQIAKFYEFDPSSNSGSQEVKELLSIKKNNEKIMLLNELGILDYLRSKYPTLEKSNNKLATIVASLTGMKKGTSQPAINSLINNNPLAKGYPINEVGLFKVRQQLISLGIDLGV